MRGGKIFISYRRDDSRADSGRLYDRLSVTFPGRVFRDVASIEPGVEWDEAIAHVLSQTDACIVVIGKNWVSITDDTGKRRMDDPHDVVRQEVAAVLRRQMRVFPILVGGAKMPAAEDLPEDLRPLCRRNAMELSEQHWDEGVQRLLQALETALKPQRQLKAAGPSSFRVPAFRPQWVLAGVGVLAVAALTWFFVNKKPANSNETADGRTAVSSATPFAGKWRAVVTTPSQRLDEDLELYPDHSLRFVSENNTVGLGKWQYDSGSDAVEVTTANNLNENVQYSCSWKSGGAAHQSLSGTCTDRQNNAWNVSLSQAPGSVVDRSFSIPRVDLSALDTAEKAAFSHSLSTERCGCGMILLICLRKHAACPYKQNLTQTALANFLRMTAHS
jgi:hypothetical protein